MGKKKLKKERKILKFLEKKKTNINSQSSSSSSLSSPVTSSSSTSLSSIDEKIKKKLKKKLRRLRKKEKLKKKEKEKRALKKLLKSKLKEEIREEAKKGETSFNIDVSLMKKSKILAPMTKEEWEKQQNTLKRVFDEETGRMRWIKGTGEIVEECVSRERHLAINKLATKGDGEFFQRTLLQQLK